jgi:hypothetical protein
MHTEAMPNSFRPALAVISMILMFYGVQGIKFGNFWECAGGGGRGASVLLPDKTRRAGGP